MLTNPSPYTITTSHESGTNLSEKCEVVIDIDSTLSQSSIASSLSSITLDPTFDLEIGSVTTDKTYSPLPFDHDNVEDNFICIKPANRGVTVQAIFSPNTDTTLNFDSNFISISEKSRKISVEEALKASPKFSLSSFILFSNSDDVNDLEVDVPAISPAIIEAEIAHHLQLDDLSSVTYPDKELSVMRHHYTYKSIAASLFITGIVLCILNEVKRNPALIIPGIFCTLMGGISGIALQCYKPEESIKGYRV
jgi:hypothetical protein